MGGGFEPGCRRPPAILLQDDVQRALGEEIPVRLVPVLLELGHVIVVPAGHAERFQGRRELVEGVGQCLALLRIGEGPVARNDQEAAADGLVEVDG
jgi:hypothetical protein